MKVLILFCGLCLLISCSSEEEMQPAQLIEASSSDVDALAIYPLPLNGRGILARDSIMEFVFDKPVLEVSINYSTKGKPDGGLPATVWELEANQLEVWSIQIGLNPAKDVTLTIIYEDETGIHKETLDVTLDSFYTEFPPDAFPPGIDRSDVRNNQVDVDANRLNQEGIRIRFSDEMDVCRTKIEVYSGEVFLNWRIDWIENNYTAILRPESEDDWLLPGQEYEIHLVDYYDYKGNRGDIIPVVIRFQTAS